MRNFKIVRVDSDYCDYLRKFDSKVIYNKGAKKLRPFIGVLFKIEKWEYFAPLSSPKPKHKIMLKYLINKVLEKSKFYFYLLKCYNVTY